MQNNETEPPPNLRRRVYVLIVIGLVFTLLILVLNLLLVFDGPQGITPFELTVTWIQAQNATIEIFIQQTQTALPQTPTP
jgi:hypothetical protein